MPIWRRCAAMARFDSLWSRPLRSAIADLLARDLDRPAVDGFEMVDAAQERGFARSRRTEDDHDLARHHVEVDALEHLVVAEGFVDVARAHQRLRRGCKAATLLAATSCGLLYADGALRGRR